MNKSEIIKQLRAERNAPFLSLNDIARSLRVGKTRAKTLLEGTDYLCVGSSRRYLASDVAEVILELRQR